MLSRLTLESYDLFKKDPPRSIAPVARQGFCNENYIVTTPKNKYVVRKLLREDVDRNFEVIVHKLAYIEEITSELVHYDPEHALMIFRYLEGEHKQKLLYEDIVLVAETLRKLHAIDTDSLLASPLPIRTFFSFSYDETVAEALDEVESHSSEYVLCHHDLNPYNLIWQKEKLKIIDFEYAGISDIYFDLASICVEFGLSLQEENAFLHAYFGGKCFFEKKLKAYKVLYKALCQQWFEKNSTKACSS